MMQVLAVIAIGAGGLSCSMYFVFEAATTIMQHTQKLNNSNITAVINNITLIYLIWCCYIF